MDKDLAQEAISAAFDGDWQKAVNINLKIITSDPTDVDALNRLARAYAETGDLKKARTTAQRAIKIDPFNTIAIKALDKYKKLKKGETYTQHPQRPEAFLEEPGKTKIVSLIHLGSSGILAKLDSADEVKLNTHSHRVSITTLGGSYVGRLPDDVSAKLKKLNKLGYEYQAFVKSADKNEVEVFIRETLRPAKLDDFPSFPSDRIDYVSFTSPELVHKKEEIEILEEEVEE